MGRLDELLQAVRQRIARAAEAASRDPSEVTLLAVSKTFPSAAMVAAHAAGQRWFGENYVQEAARKRKELASAENLRLALIGPLQSNKTAEAARVFDRIESVDRLKIGERLSAARDPLRAPLEILVQVNISGESTKSGVAPGDAVALARSLIELPRLAVMGFMGIAEPTDDVARQRAQFAALRRCREQASAQGLDLPMLSMGMSDDLESAIAEGSTEVRIGTAIFGKRR